MPAALVEEVLLKGVQCAEDAVSAYKAHSGLRDYSNF